MARIPLVREDDPATPPEAREFLKRVEAGIGEVFNAVAATRQQSSTGERPDQLRPFGAPQQSAHANPDGTSLYDGIRR